MLAWLTKVTRWASLNARQTPVGESDQVLSQRAAIAFFSARTERSPLSKDKAEGRKKPLALSFDSLKRLGI